MTAALTLEQQKANRKLWIEALRSGEYKQATQMLHDGEGFCCLGVLACVAGKTVNELGANETLRSFKDVMQFVGLSDDSGTYIARYADPDVWNDENDLGELTDLNDRGTPFTKIADIIESEPPGLFTT
jgi:hypothetical protein